MPFNRIFFCFLIISLLFLFGGCRESQKPDTDMDAFPEIQEKKEEKPKSRTVQISKKELMSK